MRLWGAARKASPSRGPSGNCADTCRNQAEAPEARPSSAKAPIPQGGHSLTCPEARPPVLPQEGCWAFPPSPWPRRWEGTVSLWPRGPHNRPQRWRVKDSATLLQAAGAEISPDPGRPPHHPVFQVRRQFSSLSLASQQGQRATSPEPMGSLHPGLAQEPPRVLGT